MAADAPGGGVASRALLAESNASGGAGEEYIWLPPQPDVGEAARILAIVPNPPASPGVLNWVHVDRLGGSQKITSGGGSVIWDYTAGPYGELEQVINPSPPGIQRVHNLRLPGQYLDTESGYRWNGFRVYDPSLGRYLQSDPIGLAGGLNTYGYVGGNPVNYVDPWGLRPLTTYEICIMSPYFPPEILDSADLQPWEGNCSPPVIDGWGGGAG